MPGSSVRIHESRAPAQRQAAVHAALAARRLPGWLLYEGEEQARRWMAYHAAWSPSRTDTGLQVAYRAAFEAAAQAVGGPLHLVGLGCGSGRKDADALAAVSSVHRARSRYTPLDASEALVTEAARWVAAAHPGVPTHPLVADLEAEPALGPALSAADEGTLPRLFTCFGMIPNMDAATFPRYLASLLAPRDVLLFSANLSPGSFDSDVATILPQYDNAPARHWYLGALEAAGLATNAVELRVIAAPLAPDGSAWQIRAEGELREAATLQVEGVTAALQPGERLRVFFSNRFTQAAARRLLTGAGLRSEQEFPYSRGEEAVFLCRRAA